MSIFNKALKQLPSGITYDPLLHAATSDLLYLVQHELDLINEEPEHFESYSELELNKIKRQCVSFLSKYKA